ncbi:MAG: alpha/beta hydrolase [Verrucomicrobiota bacterium]
MATGLQYRLRQSLRESRRRGRSAELSPGARVPHPAQMEDVAAALAWTVAHIAEYGGDPQRIDVGGHSAGGHLAALLALDGRYLVTHKLAPSLIRGVIPMSGVYQITNLEHVFGSDPAAWKAASPQSYVRAGSPPFVISYCQWDYATLPAQAREFHAALVKAGVRSELVYVPGMNHISEIINTVQPGDLTAESVLRLIGLGGQKTESPQHTGGSK